jgi:uncharacterized membrane protein YheB (UPF0754 family)
MSYIWVYDNPLIPGTPVPLTSNMSFIVYSANKKSDSNYSYIQNFSTFIEVNNYIQQQINIFMNTFNQNGSSIKNYNKTMDERFQDLYYMQLTFYNIMSQLLKNYYGKDYATMLKMAKDFNNNNEIVQNGLDELNGSSHSMSYNTNVMLDSTVYSTVLWTILAICLLYYVFIKL